MQSIPYYQQQQGYQPQPYQPQPPAAPNVLNNGPALLNHPNGLPPMQHPGIPDQSQVAAGTQPAPKRKQVKNACTNCQKACKKCDDARPCPRCIKYGIADTCVNSVRKERKKGIKRGPYKRRQKTEEKPRKNGNDMNPDQHPAQYAPVRGPAMTYGYPSNLNQYGQPFEMPYGQYAAAAPYHKDQMMSQPYVVNPVYPPMGYPVIVPGADGQQPQPNQQPQNPPQQHAYHPQYSTMIHHQQQQQAQQQQHQQQQQQQQQQAQSTSQQASASSSPRPPMMQQHNEHVMHQSSPAGSPQVYYQQAAVAAAAAAAAATPQQSSAQTSQQHSQPPSQRNSPHLPEIKPEHTSNEAFAKPTSMTPVPSTSTSTATTSSPESGKIKNERERLCMLIHIYFIGSWVPPRSS
ncbi:uncharacterized protein B0P05DRAFT_472537 [Gilbertella persicaria]|uniref:uncharacterized protein n=1 Tax=Gilbertella persicaria TaxID=101096 RepID=UPI00221FB45A|nr:uncharacterized protein B0P05DRAFT_472537 [Gilbertella persicaria]KAI8075913.1 hypothetical protein B0P05DRAFT_472537 [Gilbertella persicaria]